MIAALREKAPDSKETMEIGRDWDPTWKNKWPQESDVPGFKDTMKAFFQVETSSILKHVIETPLRHAMNSMHRS